MRILSCFVILIAILVISFANDTEEIKNENANIIYGSNYIKVENINNLIILQAINETFTKCFTQDEILHREFGKSQYELENTGQDVLFLNNCLDDDLYTYFKNVFIETVNDFEQQLNDPLFTSLRSYDYEYIIQNVHRLEARVAEHIIYHTNGHVGYHTDDDSIITMVSLLNNNFTGGNLEIRQNSIDENVETISLKQGDIIMFPSMADHQVLPITSGDRYVFVIEWWPLPRCTVSGRLTPQDFIQILEQHESHQEL